MTQADRPTESSPAADWRKVADWQDGVVTSDGRGRAFIRWILPVVVNGLTWTVAATQWHVLDQIPGGGLLALAFFGILGLVLVWSALRATLRYLRQGQMFLRMTPFPARLGQRIRLSVTLPAAFRTQEMHVSLACQRALPKADERVMQHTELWQERRQARPQIGAQGPLLACEFDLPTDQPASAWRAGKTAMALGVDWVVRIESPDGTLDRSFTIPVLEGQGEAAPQPSSSATTPRDDSRLAEPYIERRGGIWTIDSRGLPGAGRGHVAGVAMFVFGLLCFTFPTLWFSMSRWEGQFETALSIGIGLLLLLPVLVGLLLIVFGLQLMGRRVRTTLADGQLTTDVRNWLWVTHTRIPCAMIEKLEVEASVRMQDAQRNDGVFELLARLQNGRRILVAWGLRDAASAAALAEVLLRACREKVGAGGTATGRGFRRRHRPGLPLLAVLLSPPLLLLAFQWVLRHPEWHGQPHDPPDDQTRLAWLAERASAPGYLAHWLGKDKGLRWPPGWLSARWVGEARARLAASRQAPAGVTVTDIPSGQAPQVDGVIDADEWRSGLALALEPLALGSTVRLRHDGKRLYFAADVPADTTAEGFDQLRVWFHLALTPNFENERVFLGRHDDIRVLRGLRRITPAGEKRLTQRLYYEQSAGASRVAGHRQYELALDLAEAGLVPGVPFTLWIEIEGDPQRHPDGKFKARTILGQAASYKQPGWYRLTP